MMVNPPPWTNEEMNHNNVYSPNMMRHYTGVVVDWTPQEDQHLLDRLASCPMDLSLARYAEVAECLQDKGVRDVAMRWKWICRKKENAKRRKKDHNGLGRVARYDNKEIIDMVVASQQFEPPQNGITNELLQENVQCFEQISENFKSLSPMDNVHLFTKIGKNIITCLQDLNENMSETMKRMPPLPEKLNVELLFAIFPSSHLP